jgi:hypothetical protein
MTANKHTVAGAAAAILLVAAAGALVLGRQHGDLAGTAASGDNRGAASAAAGAATPAAKAAQDAHRNGDKPLWRSLTPAQQRALQPLQAEWDGLDGLRKQKWLQLANRFAALPPAEQQRMHERMRAWAALSPEQRELARETYNRTRRIAPDKKTATWESYQQLPDDEKKKLAAASATRKAPAVAPGQAGGKAVAPLGQGAAACPAGTLKNPVSATPACVPAPAPGAPVQPATAPQPAAPAQPDKQVPANWGITPNDA